MNTLGYARTMNFFLQAQLPYPLLVYGETGIGKTTVPIAMAEKGVLIDGKEAPLPVIYMNATGMEPPDLQGLPHPEDRGGVKTTRFLPPDHLAMVGIPGTDEFKLINEVPRGLFIIDEVTRLEHQVRNTVMQLLDRREIGSLKIPKGWLIVLTANPASGEYQVSDLDIALLRRCIVLELEYKLDTWRQWAIGAGLHPKVIGIAGRLQRYVGRLKAPIKQTFTPFGMEVASHLVNAGLADIETEDTKGLKLEILAGAMGADAAGALDMGLSDQALDCMFHEIMAGDPPQGDPTLILEAIYMFIAHVLDEKRGVLKDPKKTGDLVYKLFQNAPAEVRPILAKYFMQDMLKAEEGSPLDEMAKEWDRWIQGVIKAAPKRATGPAKGREQEEF